MMHALWMLAVGGTMMHALWMLAVGDAMTCTLDFTIREVMMYAL